MNDRTAVKSNCYLPPQVFPANEDLAEPLDNREEQELLEHRGDDDGFNEDNNVPEGYW